MTSPSEPVTWRLVGALIHDDPGRLFIHRRSLSRRLFPGGWDIVGGTVERGETDEVALAREIQEETSWQLKGVTAWVADRVIRLGDELARERVALVEVRRSGPPRLEVGKHVEYAWVGPDDAVAAANLALGYGDHIPSLLAAGFAALKSL